MLGGLPLAPGTGPGEVLADFVSGQAFTRVFEVGSDQSIGCPPLVPTVPTPGAHWFCSFFGW